MSGALIRSVLYSLAPVAGMALAGVAAALLRPGGRVRSYIQHFAAGVVFAAVGVEVLPQVMHRERPVSAAVGFGIGVAAMLLIRAISRRAEREAERSGTSLPWALIAAVGVDVLVDGMLIGVGFAAGERQGILLAVALTGCSVSLGLATAASVEKAASSRRWAIGMTGVLAILPALGAAGGALLASRLQGAWMEGVLAFTCAALLYLVTEELLLEAHEELETPETAFTTAMFFAGFLALLVGDMVM